MPLASGFTDLGSRRLEHQIIVFAEITKRVRPHPILFAVGDLRGAMIELPPSTPNADRAAQGPSPAVPGQIGLEACLRYNLSVEELFGWELSSRTSTIRPEVTRLQSTAIPWADRPKGSSVDDGRRSFCPPGGWQGNGDGNPRAIPPMDRGVPLPTASRKTRRHGTRRWTGALRSSDGSPPVSVGQPGLQ